MDDNDFTSWSTERVGNWLLRNGCPKSVVDILIEQECTGFTLLYSDEQALIQLGIKPIHAHSICNLIKNIKKFENTTTTTNTSNNININNNNTLNNNINSLNNNSKNVKEELLNRYSTIINELGSGAFGIVYQVKRKNQSIAAVKVIYPSLEFDMNQALHEAIQTVKVSHENIIRVHTAFISNNQSFLCIEMDCLEFGNLFDYFIKNPNNIPSEKMILLIIEQMGNALKHIQKFNIIHKDIKPANILIKSINTKQDNIQVCLSDFGFAKTNTNSSTEISQLSGTFKYLAPEIIDYEILDIKQPYSTQSDIFALGVTLYYLMTRDLSTLCNSMCKHPKLLKDYFVKYQRMKYSDHLIELILKMMSLQPNDRPSIEQLIQQANQTIIEKPIELPVYHLCLATFYGSPAHTNITKSLNIYRNSHSLIGVDFRLVSCFDHKFICWFLAEQERFKIIFETYMRNAKAMILLIDCSKPALLDSCLQVANNYFPSHLKTIFIAFSDGPSIDLDSIRNQLKIENAPSTTTLIGINWCRKQYQQNYIRQVTFASLLDDNQMFEIATTTYNQQKSEEPEHLTRIAKEFSVKSFSVLELLDVLDNVDYSNLLEYFEDINVKNTNSVLSNNLKYLYFIAIIEENGKIIDALKSTPKLETINIDGQKISLTKDMYYIDGPLHRACVLEYLPAIQWYSNNYPHFHEEQGIDCGYPLEIAIENRNTIIFEWIFNNCNLSSNVLSSALVTVADINGSAEWAQNLIKKGASIEFVQKYATEKGKQHLITYINKNCKDNKSWNFFKFFNNK